MNLKAIETKNESANRPWGTLAQDEVRALIEHVRELRGQLKEIQEGRLVWAMGCECYCSICTGFDALIRQTAGGSTESDEVEHKRDERA